MTVRNYALRCEVNHKHINVLPEEQEKTRQFVNNGSRLDVNL